MEASDKAIELKEFWSRYKLESDEVARERLVLAYSPLVKYIAGRMAASLPAHVEEADLISYGLIGLIAAVERFDVDREIKFETFAITRIKGSIIDELRSLDWVPRSVRARAARSSDSSSSAVTEEFEVLGVTESRVSQLHTKAILRLKSRLGDEALGEVV